MKLSFKSPVIVPTQSAFAKSMGQIPTAANVDVVVQYEAGDRPFADDVISLAVQGAPRGKTGLAAAKVSSNFTFAPTGGVSRVVRIKAPIIDWADGSTKGYEVVARAFDAEGVEIAESETSARIEKFPGEGTGFAGRPIAYGVGGLYDSE